MSLILKTRRHWLWFFFSVFSPPSFQNKTPQRSCVPPLGSWSRCNFLLCHSILLDQVPGDFHVDSPHSSFRLAAHVIYLGCGDRPHLLTALYIWCSGCHAHLGCLSRWWFLLFLCLAVRQILLKTVNRISQTGISKIKSLKERKRGTGETARWLRAHTALVESLSSIPSSHTEPALDPGYPMPFLVNCVDICTHMNVSAQRHMHERDFIFLSCV